MDNCRICGKNIKKDDYFCENCGSQIDRSFSREYTKKDSLIENSNTIQTPTKNNLITAFHLHNRMTRNNKNLEEMPLIKKKYFEFQSLKTILCLIIIFTLDIMAIQLVINIFNYPGVLFIGYNLPYTQSPPIFLTNHGIILVSVISFIFIIIQSIIFYLLLIRFNSSKSATLYLIIPSIHFIILLIIYIFNYNNSVNLALGEFLNWCIIIGFIHIILRFRYFYNKSDTKKDLNSNSDIHYLKNIAP